MSTPRVVLEILGANDAVTQRARVATLPATVGRGAANDLVVDDPYVDAAHLRIDEDASGLYAEDAGSVNGLRVGDGGERVARTPLTHGAVMRIGRTRIRIVDPAVAVAPALVDGAAAAPAMPIESTSAPPAAVSSSARSVALRIAAPVALAAAGTVETWLSTIERGDASKIAFSGIGYLIVAALWAGIWAVGGRLSQRHRALFTYHNAIASLLILAVLADAATVAWLDFLWPSERFAIPDTVIMLGVIALALAMHLRYASTMSRKKRYWIAAGATVGLWGLISLSEYADRSKWTDKMTFAGQLKPVPVSLVPSEAITDLTKSMKDLRTTVDKAALDAKKLK